MHRIRRKEGLRGKNLKLRKKEEIKKRNRIVMRVRA